MTANESIRILLATKAPFSPSARDAALAIASSAGIKFSVLENYNDRSELLAAAADCNALIVRSDKVDSELLDAAPGLKLVIRGGAGYNSIDVDACSERGITVMNTPGQNSNAVAELALGFMLSVARHLPVADTSTKAGEFRKSALAGNELKGRRLGLHGFGYIGQLVAEKARGFGMQVYAYDPWVSAETARDKGATLVETPEELYRDADVISMHIPKNEKTTGSVGYELLHLMRPDATLVNTARAEVINFKGLETILSERAHFKYASDVHPEGDVPGEKSVARFADQVLLTPHIGASTAESNFNTACAAAKQAVDFFLYGRMTAAVNKEVVPYWMQRYADLAQSLGLLAQRLGSGQPREVQVLCYGELKDYKGALANNVLKGIYADMGGELTPAEAASMARENGVVIRLEMKPDDTRGHGNSITVDYMVKTGAQLEQVSVRGTVAGDAVKISRIKEFENVDFIPGGLVTIFEYDEKEGMMDAIGEYFTTSHYNKKQGRFIQGPNGTRAITVFQVEKKQEIELPDGVRSEDEEVAAIAAGIKKDIPEILNAVAIRFRSPHTRPQAS